MAVSEAVHSHPISRLRTPEQSELPDNARALLAVHHHENWIRALSLNPDAADRFASYFGSLFAGEGRRLPLKRELIAVIVSRPTAAGYAIHHTRTLGDILDVRGRAHRIALAIILSTSRRENMPSQNSPGRSP